VDTFAKFGLNIEMLAGNKTTEPEKDKTSTQNTELDELLSQIPDLRFLLDTKLRMTNLFA